MSLLRRLSRPRQYVCHQCIRRQHTLARGERPKAQWAAEDPDPAIRQSEWEERAGRIRSGAQQSMLNVLEERGFVKDVAGYTRLGLINKKGVNTSQRAPDTRLVANGKTNWSLRRRRSYGSLVARRSSSPTHGIVLDVSPRLLHRQLGERPAELLYTTAINMG